jgi:protein TonB
MILNRVFYDQKAASRLNYGIACAVLVHISALVCFYINDMRLTIAPDLRGAPTSVNIRFIAPERPQEFVQTQTLQKPAPVKQKIEKQEKPVAQELVKSVSVEPVQLSRIEPAAAPVFTEQEQQKAAPVQIAPLAQIPVVNEVNLKGSRIAPEYPRRALRLRQEGIVRLHVLVSETGTQQDIKIVRNSGFSMLDEAALKAVRRWNFEPTRIGGRAVKSWVEIPVEFKIN